MYTRSYPRNSRSYTPPPGYDGNAFSDAESPGVKFHEATQETEDFRRRPHAASPPETALPEPPVPPPPPTPTPSVLENGFHSLEALFRHLRGQFGREELILVLVMLLISSDASLELLLLALVLTIR